MSGHDEFSWALLSLINTASVMTSFFLMLQLAMMLVDANNPRIFSRSASWDLMDKIWCVVWWIQLGCACQVCRRAHPSYNQCIWGRYIPPCCRCTGTKRGDAFREVCHDPFYCLLAYYPAFYSYYKLWVSWNLALPLKWHFSLKFIFFCLIFYYHMRFQIKHDITIYFRIETGGVFFEW